MGLSYLAINSDPTVGVRPCLGSVGSFMPIYKGFKAMFESILMLAVKMPDLSNFQFSIVDNVFSMTVATMGAAAIFLFLSRSSVDEAYWKPARPVRC